MVPKKDKDKFAQQVMGRIQMEEDFAYRFKENPDEALEEVSKDLEINLDEDEKNEMEKLIKKNISPLPFLSPEEMKDSINNITKRADAGYKKVQGMSTVLFVLGIGVIIAAFILDIYGVLTEMNWQPMVASSGVLGGIGVITIYESTYKLPDKVKNSVADLVQIKVAVFGYFDQLVVLMRDELKNNDADQAFKIVYEINAATNGVMNKIQKYCESGQSDKPIKTPA